jgi:D-inositol-3-phosphate glycosyltransferase
VIGEEQVVAAATRLVASTDAEGDELVSLYDARPDQVCTIAPGVDLTRFSPGISRAASLAAVGLPADALLLLFVGRIQPLKAPDVLLRAAAELLRRDPSLRSRLRVDVVGGPSGTGTRDPENLADLTRELGIVDAVRLIEPVSQERLAEHYRAAEVVVVPSYNESFGLVAIEAQACGTPVVAARVGGLSTAVSDGVSGVLVDGHDPADYASALHRLLTDPELREAMSQKAVRHAETFGWDVTADRTLAVYDEAIDSYREESA